MIHVVSPAGFSPIEKYYFSERNSMPAKDEQLLYN
jgi:hypothetical protein